jgi:hypothetical protein
MKNIAVPINDARDVQWATAQAIELYRRDTVRIHLINVQHPLSRHVSKFFNGHDIHDFHRDAGMRVLEPAIKALDEAGVPHKDHVLVGRKVDCIVRFAKEYSCSRVILDDRAEGFLSVFGLGSIASQVRQIIGSDTPDKAASTSAN